MDLLTFFKENPVAALGFSGGADSSYLLYAGLHYGARIKAYYIKTAFQPKFELEDAQKVALQLGAEISIIDADVLAMPNVAVNTSDRCYHCKTALFTLIKEKAAADGFELLIDGTNASDDAGDRPGMKALEELSIRSPLKECGITKTEVRRRSKEAGLFTWDKPAYACLATRIPVGMAIKEKDLKRVENAEDILFSMGFTDFRVRLTGDFAKLQFPVSQMSAALMKREEIMKRMHPMFESVLMDLEGRKDREIII